MREMVNPPSVPRPRGYSQVVQVSPATTIYLAGQVAWDVDGNLVGEGDFAAQTRQVFTNVQLALEAMGAALSDLVKIGIFVVDHDTTKLEIIRSVRDEFFADITPPASTLLGVAALAAPDLMIEIDGVACLDDRPTPSVRQRDDEVTT